jgi:phage head maturation protease
VVDGKLVNRVEFCTDNPMGNLAYKMAKGGFIKSQSVGFIPLEWANGKKDGEPDRTYTKTELLEISLVSVPANPGATVGLALRSGAVEKSDLRELAEFLKQFCSEEADPAGKAGASVGGVFDARAQQLMVSLKGVFRGL